MASKIWQLTGTKQWEKSVKLLRKATDPLLNASCSKYWELLFYINLLENNPVKLSNQHHLKNMLYPSWIDCLSRYFRLGKNINNLSAKCSSTKSILCFIINILITPSAEVLTSSPVKIYHVWWPLWNIGSGVFNIPYSSVSLLCL